MIEKAQTRKETQMQERDPDQEREMGPNELKGCCE
jgi:hypothetical protein